MAPPRASLNPASSLPPPAKIGPLRAGLALAAYRLAWLPALPLAMTYMGWRSRLQPAYRSGIGQRLGFQGAVASDGCKAVAAGAGPLVWLHAVSVGETRAAQPLVRGLLQHDPTLRMLLTHMTPTGLETGAEVFADLIGGDDPRLCQVYLPWDSWLGMRTFFATWRPVLGIVMETELWPEMVAQAQAAQVPLVLVSARLSEKSLRKARRSAWLLRPALAGVARVLAQTEADAGRLRLLGRTDVQVIGNLKFDVEPPAGMEALGHRWRRALLGRAPTGAPSADVPSADVSSADVPSTRVAPGVAGTAGSSVRHVPASDPRPVLLFASTRDGEEALLLDAWQAALADTEDGAVEPPPGMPWPPLLVIVPRHPERFDEVANGLRERGIAFTRRSEWVDDAPPAQARNTQVVLGDSMGEMFAYYALSDVAIIGGSLLPFGGQNLIEACAAGVAVIIGPHMFNFESVARQALLEDAAVHAADAGAALQRALALLADPVARQSMGERAAAFARRHRGATARALHELTPMLDRALARDPARDPARNSDRRRA